VNLWWKTAEISGFKDIQRTFIDRKDIWWFLSEEIPGILHEWDANHQVMLNVKHCYTQCSEIQNIDFVSFKLIGHSNLDKNNPSWLHVVYILQHPTPCPTTKSTQDTKVGIPKKNILPLPVGIYATSTLLSRCQCHQVNDGKGCSVAGRIPALTGWHSLWSKTKLLDEKIHEIHFLSNNSKYHWIDDSCKPKHLCG
jgi:hypothetical protein